MFPLATSTHSHTMDLQLHSHHLSLNLHRSSLPTPLSSSSSSSSVSFRSLPPHSSFKFSPIRASSSKNDPAFHKPTKNTIPQLLQTLITPFLSPVVETTVIVVAATAFFFMRFHPMPVIAAPLAPPTATVESSPEENAEKERVIEEKLSNNPSDIEALRSLMELKIRARKINEAIGVIERLIELEPEEFEWPLLKAHMHVYNDDHELARNVFEEILERDPLRVDAYHGLLMATKESNEPLDGFLKRVEEAVELCKKQKKDSEVRDFKLLIAQLKVMEGEFAEALKAYQELVKEEPRDFRPYLCQGIIYTLLRQKDEAEKQFNTFRKLVPKNHPYREYFEDNMFATKFFSQKFEREGAGARS